MRRGIGWHQNASELKEPLNNSARSAFCRRGRRSVGATRVTVAVATAERRNDRNAASPAKPLRDGPLRGLRLVWARLFGMTKPRSPKPSRSLPQRRRRARAELFRGSLTSTRPFTSSAAPGKATRRPAPIDSRLSRTNPEDYINPPRCPRGEFRSLPIEKRRGHRGKFLRCGINLMATRAVAAGCVRTGIPG